MCQHLLQLFGTNLHLFYNVVLTFSLGNSNAVPKKFNSFSHLNHVTSVLVAIVVVLFFQVIEIFLLLFCVHSKRPVFKLQFLYVSNYFLLLLNSFHLL